MGRLDDGLGPFKDIIPATAIAICVVTAYDSHRRGNIVLSAALVIWFLIAVFVSLLDAFVLTPGEWNLPEDVPGFVGFASLPMVPIVTLYIVYQSRSAFQEYVLKTVPPSFYIGLQVYRLAGGAYLYMYFNGSFHNFVGLQTGVLDLFIGFSALPMAWLVHSQGLKNVGGLVRVWHAIGLYDIASVFGLCFANFIGFYQTEPNLSVFAFYPASLIVLFQVPLAMGIHVLFLTQMHLMVPPKDGDKKDS
jgi:hypothetical protein